MPRNYVRKTTGEIKLLTDDERDQMACMYGRGEKVSAIAAKFKVHKSYPRLCAKRRGITRISVEGNDD